MRTLHIDFITSDMHVGHAFAREWRGIPDWSVEAMDELLIKAWNSVVPEDAAVAVLGDAVMGKRSVSLPKLDLMNGRKILFPGNHDNCWKYNPKRISEKNNWPEIYGQYFEEFLDDGVYEIPGLGEVQISHFSRYGDTTNEERYEAMRPAMIEGTWLLHGHVHQLWRVMDDMINVGMDAWGIPLSIDDISVLMDQGPRNAPVPFTFIEMMRMQGVV